MGKGKALGPLSLQGVHGHKNLSTFPTLDWLVLVSPHLSFLSPAEGFPGILLPSAGREKEEDAQGDNPLEPPPPFTHLAVTKTERRMDSRGLWFMGHLESWSSAVNSVFGLHGRWVPGVTSWRMVGLGVLVGRLHGDWKEER